MAFPDDGRDLEVGIFIAGEWVDGTTAGNGVRADPGVSIRSGRANWTSKVDPGRATFTLDNRDGRWSPDNAAGAYAGTLQRNLPCRVGVGHGTPYLTWRGGSSQQVASTPDAVALDITGDIGMRALFRLHAEPADITADPTGAAIIARKRADAATTGWSWILYLSGGELHTRLAWYDSSNVLQTYDTQDLGQAIPVRYLHDLCALQMTLDVNDGAADSVWRCYYAAPADITGPWIELGAGTGASGQGVTDIGANTADLWVGGMTSTEQSPLEGELLAYELDDGITSPTTVAAPDFSAEAVGTSSFSDGSRTWTVGAGGRITDQRWRFHGELASIVTEWTVDGADVTAPFEAAGLFRRLRQSDRVESAIRRNIERDAANLVQYWPTEETGDFVDEFGPAVGSAALVINGTAKPADNGDFLCSLKLPTLDADTWTAVVDSYVASTGWQVRFNLSVADDFTGANLVILRVETEVLNWEVHYSDTVDGSLRVVAYNQAGTAVHTHAYVDFDLEGIRKRVTFGVEDNGANVDVTLEGVSENESAAAGYTHASAVTSTSSGQVSAITINPYLDCAGMSIGHIALHSAVSASSEMIDEMDVHDGETAGARIRRLCAEQGIRARMQGDAVLTETMGPQLPDTFMALLEECADTDGGILYESPTTIAVAYRTRQSMLAQGDRLTDPTGQQLWFSAFDARTAGQTLLPNRVTESANGPLLFDSTNPPTVTVGATAAATVVDFDGTADFATFDYVPAGITPTPTSSLTLFLAGKWSTAMTSSALARMVSFESGTDFDGIAIHGGPATNDTPRVTIGGATTSVDVDPPDGALSDGDTFVFVAVVDHSDGKLYAQLDDGARSAGASISGVGTITLATTPRVGSLAELSTPPSVVATASAFVSSGLPTVTNPDPTGSGTLIFISNCQGFGNSGTITWTAPDAGATVEDTLTNGAGQFYSQCRIWSMTNDQAASYTFGGNSTDERQSGVIIALDAVATSILKSGSFDVTSGAGPHTYPTVTSTQADDMVLAIMLQQTADQLTAGPSGYTEQHNDTASSPNRTAVHSLLQTTSTDETPGNATWSGTAGAKVAYTLAVRGPAVIGGQYADFGLLDLVAIERALSTTEARTEAIRIRDRLQLGALPLNYANGDLAVSPRPVRDDQLFRNDVIAANRRGGQARAALDDGSPLSISEPPTGAGSYPRTVDVNTQAERLPTIAQRYLDLGVVDEPRIAQLTVAFHAGLAAQSDLADMLLRLSLGDLVTVDNNLSAWLNGAQIAQLVQGVREEIGTHAHFLDMLTSPGSPLRFNELLTLSDQLGFQGTPDYERNTGGPRTLTNPVQSTGNTIIAACLAPYYLEEASGSYSPPDATAQVIFDYPGNGKFVNRIRVWVLEDDGSATYTFGWNGVTNIQTCLLLGLNGVAGDAFAVATPIVNVATNTAYPTLSTEPGDLVAAFAGQQNTDELTAGPSGYTEQFNITGTVSSRGMAVHSAIADSTATTPGNATWDGTVAAHIQTVLGFRK